MDFNIPPILSAQQLLDKAFRKASKKSKEGANREESTKKTNSAKLNSVAHTLEDTLKRYEKEFPSIDILPQFYHEIIDIMIGIDKLKKSIGAVNWAKRRTKRILMESARKLMKKETVEEMERIRKQAYGRTSSILNQIDDDLAFLDECKKKLNSLPDIQTDIPTVVVAGYPNVGKSLLVSKISSGKPKVAVYPFTTKEVGIGHFMLERHKCQLLDTPGLLDRPSEKRNDIEKQAVNALESLADLILFLYDPTGTCGYPVSDQEALAAELKESFRDVKIIEVDNKSDIDESDNQRLHISALQEKNLDELMGSIKNGLKYKYDL
ncbi:MAG: GTPase [Candidatus Saliniplasma sp.]